MPRATSVEHEIVLLCSRTRIDSLSTQRIRELAESDLDWTAATRAAVLHGVAALVYQQLSQHANVPDARIGALRERFFLNAGNSLLLARELDEVLTRFDDEGIAAMPYKGPVLATMLYGTPSLREFTDINVLVRPVDVLKAADVLLRRGYEPQTPLSSAQAHTLVRSRSGYFFRFDRPMRAGRIAFELHWRIPSTFALDEDGFWNRAEAVQLLGKPRPHFSREDLLLVLCMHGFKHAWNTLKWICDVGQLISTCPQLDWDKAIEQSRQTGGLRIVLVGCGVAHVVLGTELPGTVKCLLEEDAAALSLVRLLNDRLFNRPLPRVGVVNNLKIRERTSDKIRYGVDLIAHVTHPVALAGRMARKYRPRRPV